MSETEMKKKIQGKPTRPETVKVEHPESEASGGSEEEMPLSPIEATTVALAQERITTSQLSLQMRQKELEGVILQIKAKYEANGKFQLLSLDPTKGTIVRKPL